MVIESYPTEQMLAEVEVKAEAKKGKYRVFGTTTDDEIEATRVEKQNGNKWEAYEDEDFKWSGSKYTANDILENVMTDYSLDYEEDVKVSYLCNELQALVDNREVVADYNGKPIYDTIIGYYLYPYKLTLATDNFLFYVSDDRTMMFSTETRNLLSDNYFAENAFVEECEDILKGESKILWKDDDLDLEEVVNG